MIDEELRVYERALLRSGKDPKQVARELLGIDTPEKLRAFALEALGIDMGHDVPKGSLIRCDFEFVAGVPADPPIVRWNITYRSPHPAFLAAPARPGRMLWFDMGDGRGPRWTDGAPPQP